MTDLEKKPFACGIAGTIGIWMLLLMLMSVYSVFLKPKEYKTIQITLDTVKEMEQKNIVREKPVLNKKSAETAKSEDGKSDSQKKDTVKTSEKAVTEKAVKNEVVKNESQVLQKSVEELMAEQFKSKKQTAQWAMADDAVENQSVNKISPAAPVVSQKTQALSGKAASSASNVNGPALSASKTTKQASSDNLSADTEKALASIKTVRKSMSYNDNVKGESIIDIDQRADGYAFVVSGGNSRVLIEPKTPVIVLSEEEASSIDATKKLTITFTITKDGYVQSGNVKISPEGLVSSIVKDAIVRTVSSWRFSAANTDSVASFKYNINKS